MFDILCKNMWTCENCVQSAIDQKQQVFDDSEQCLAIFYLNKDEFFRRYITMEETWLLHYSQTSGLNAMNRIQKVKKHNGQLASVLRNARGIIFIDYLDKGQTINSVYYIALLERLNDEIKKKRRHLKKKSAVSSRQYNSSQINQNDGKIA
jgi:hypothetical protein